LDGLFSWTKEQKKFCHLRTRKKKAALVADSFFDLGPLEDRESNPPGVTREKEAVQYWTAFFRGRKSKRNFAQLRTRKKKAALAADSFFDLGPLEDRENNPPGVTREKEAVQYWTAFFRGRKSKRNFAN